MLHQDVPTAPATDPTKGLFRTALAGQGHTLHDAFANLERMKRVEREVRHGMRNMFGARVALHTDDGEGYWDFMRARDDIYVIVENYAFKEPRVEHITDDGVLQFYFELSGDLTMTIPGAETLRLNQPNLLIYHQQRGMEFTASTAPSARQRSVIVNVRPQFLIETFVGDHGGMPPLLSVLLNSASTAVLPYFRLPLNAPMFDLVTRLVESHYEGVIGLVNMEALVMELLCAAVAHVGSAPTLIQRCYTQRELRCLHAARDLLMKEIRRPPTICTLARVIGLNQTTLKQAFKAVFGETPFELSLRCRMGSALKLLRDDHMPVAQVADAVGYSHPTSFATAFRRHYGIQPQQAYRQARQPDFAASLR